MLFQYKTHSEKDAQVLCWYQFFTNPYKKQQRHKHFERHTHKNLKIVFVKSCGKIEYMLVADLVHIITHHLRSIC